MGIQKNGGKKCSATLFSLRVITDVGKDLDWSKRLIYLDKQYPGTSVLLHKSGVLTDSKKNVFLKMLLKRDRFFHQ